MEQPPPPAHTYWVVPGRLLAGGYPGISTSWDLPDLLEDLLSCDVSLFLDFTEPNEHETVPYEPYLQDAAARLGREILYRRVPITDFAVPSASQMHEIIGLINGGLSSGHRIYMHCFAGIGRTATVAGCYLISTGLTPRVALARLAALRAGTSFEGTPYPATAEQTEFVLAWPPLGLAPRGNQGPER